MTLDDVANDGEAEAGATGVACSGVVKSGEAFEDDVMIFGWDSVAIVADGEQNTTLALVEADSDCRCGVPFCVVEQVADRSCGLMGIKQRSARKLRTPKLNGS